MCVFSGATAVNEVLSKTFSFAIVSLITMQIRSAFIWCCEPWKHHHHHIVSLTLINLSEMVFESLFFAIYRGTKQQIHHQHFSFAHNPGSIFLNITLILFRINYIGIHVSQNSKFFVFYFGFQATKMQIFCVNFQTPSHSRDSEKRLQNKFHHLISVNINQNYKCK